MKTHELELIHVIEELAQRNLELRQPKHIWDILDIEEVKG